MASLVQQALGYVKETFSAYTSISGTATSDRISTNPLEKSIENLNGRYSLGQTDVGQYVKFGTNDDFPTILDRMLRQSPVHSGIITKKAKMVSGKGILYNFDNIKTPAKQAEIKAFISNCAGKSQGLYDQIVHSAFENEHKGALAIYVKWNQEHTKPVEMRSLDIKGVRAAEPVNGKVTHYIIRRRFGPNALSMQDNEPRLIPVFDKFKKNREEILYVKNPYSGNEFYGVPNYISAYHYIAADFEFGKHIQHSAKNGFTPKVLATFIGRNMTNEQKRDEFNKFKASFTGAEGETVIASWVKNKEEAPMFTPLDVSNLDKTVDVLSRLNDAKILTAHNITSPTLFGVMVAGRLGGTGNELVGAYQIFRATETLPNRELVLAAYNRILSVAGYDKINLEIDEELVNLESLKGANTEDVSNG
jgi:hypothetical protein